jgi:hypothetical protein
VYKQALGLKPEDELLHLILDQGTGQDRERKLRIVFSRVITHVDSGQWQSTANLDMRLVSLWQSIRTIERG